MKESKKNKVVSITPKRRETYLPEEVAELLVAQIGNELDNEYLYHNFALWFDNNSYFGQAAYFYKRKEEEKSHAQWIIDYLLRSDYPFEIPPTRLEMIDIHLDGEAKKPDVIKPHRMTLDREIGTTHEIYAIYKKATEKEDFITMLWLKRLLEEQAEEESLSHVALEVFKHTTDPLLVDKYFKDVVLPRIG